jgi:hypothetical protein
MLQQTVYTNIQKEMLEVFSTGLRTSIGSLFLETFSVQILGLFS